jgi:hypothetical protein
MVVAPRFLDLLLTLGALLGVSHVSVFNLASDDVHLAA